MHILYISNAIPRPEEPGAARPWVEATFLARQGHQVTVITNQRHYLTDQIPEKMQGRLISTSREGGLEILAAATPAGRRTSLGRRVISYFCFMLMALYAGLRTRGVDLVFVRTPPILTPIAGLCLARLKRARLVLFIGDLHPEASVAVGLIKCPLLITAWEWLENFLRRRAQLLVTPIPAIKRLLEGKGFSPDKILLNTNAYDPVEDRRQPLPREVEHKLACLNGHFLVAYAGTIGLADPFDVVIDTARDLQKTHPHIRFIFAGQGDKLPELTARARRLKLQNVVFLGVVPRYCMTTLLDRVQVLLYLTRAGEFHGHSLPNKIFEYLGSGKPVIYAGIGDIAGIITGARCGIVVPPENSQALAQALLSLNEAPARAAKMGHRGRAYVMEHFNREKILATLNRELEGLAQAE